MSISVLLYQSLKLLHMNYTTALHITKFQVSFSSGRFSCLPDYGGGAFLIPYVSMLVLGALPLFYMELILGQFHRQGPISVWRISPIFKGVGFCAVFIAFFVSFYYNVIIGWAFHFLFSSFSWRLPWKVRNHINCRVNCVVYQDCMNEWNTEFCAIKCINSSPDNDSLPVEFDSFLYKVKTLRCWDVRMLLKCFSLGSRT